VSRHARRSCDCISSTEANEAEPAEGELIRAAQARERRVPSAEHEVLRPLLERRVYSERSTSRRWVVGG
jgi:hypothetical protein